MRKFKKILGLVFATIMVFSICAVMALAAGEQGGSSGGVNLSVTAMFARGTWYHGDPNTNKITYRCWVHLEEGSYNKTSYSVEGPKKYQPGDFISAYLQKINNPFITSKASWGFETCYPQ